jgi:DNA polymerase III subunit delta
MLYSQLHKKIKNNQISPIYLLYGTEMFLIEETKREIIHAVLNEEDAEFNLSTYNMQEQSVDTAIEDAETLPFMGGKKVVIIKDPLFLTGQKDKSKIEHDLKRFDQYINMPYEESVLLIIAPFEKLDERKKIVKTLKAKSEVFHASEMNDSMVKDWMTKRVEEFNVVISDSAAELLVNMIGPKLMLLSNEIDKMAMYVGEGGVIKEEEVLSLTSRSLEQNIFVLIEKVVQRKVDEALRIYYDLLRQNEEPIKVLSLIVQQFRLIYQVKELSSRGYGQKQIASQLKVHPYRVKLAAIQGKGFEDKQLLEIINQLADADYHMKTGKMDKALLLELFFMKLKNTN